MKSGEYRSVEVCRVDPRGVIWWGVGKNEQRVLMVSCHPQSEAELVHWHELSAESSSSPLGLLYLAQSGDQWILVSRPASGIRLVEALLAQGSSRNDWAPVADGVLSQLLVSESFLDRTIPISSQIVVSEGGVVELLGIPWLQIPGSLPKNLETTEAEAYLVERFEVENVDAGLAAEPFIDPNPTELIPLVRLSHRRSLPLAIVTVLAMVLTGLFVAWRLPSANCLSADKAEIALIDLLEKRAAALENQDRETLTQIEGPDLLTADESLLDQFSRSGSQISQLEFQVSEIKVVSCGELGTELEAELTHGEYQRCSAGSCESVPSQSPVRVRLLLAGEPLMIMRVRTV